MYLCILQTRLNEAVVGKSNFSFYALRFLVKLQSRLYRFKCSWPNISRLRLFKCLCKLYWGLADPTKTSDPGFHLGPGLFKPIRVRLEQQKSNNITVIWTRSRPVSWTQYMKLHGLWLTRSTFLFNFYSIRMSTFFLFYETVGKQPQNLNQQLHNWNQTRVTNSWSWRVINQNGTVHQQF